MFTKDQQRAALLAQHEAWVRRVAEESLAGTRDDVVASDARDAIMVRSDARAIGLVSSFNTRVSERWAPSTDHGRASACISYHAADKSDAVIFRAARADAQVKRTTVKHDNGTSYAKRLEQLGAVGNID